MILKNFRTYQLVGEFYNNPSQVHAAIVKHPKPGLIKLKTED